MSEKDQKSQSHFSMPRRRKRPEREKLTPAFEQDKSPFDDQGFLHRFRSFRKSGLGFGDSLFNAFYISVCERSVRQEKKRVEKEQKLVSREHFFDLHTPLLRLLAAVLRFFRSLAPESASIVKKEQNASKRRKSLFFLNRYRSHLLLVVLAVFFVIFAAVKLTTPVVIRAEIGGEVIGVVQNQYEVETAINELEETVGFILGKSFRFPYPIDYTLTRERGQTTDRAKISEELYKRIRDQICTASGLYIDRTLVAVCSDSASIEEEMQAFVKQKAGDGDTGIFNEVQIVTQAYPTSCIIDRKELHLVLEQMCIPLEMRKTATENEKEPSLLPSVLAHTTEPLPDVLLLTDVEMPDDKDRITLSNYPQSYDHILLRFYTAQIQSYDADVPYKTRYVESAERYTSMADVTQRGKVGRASVQAKVYFVDGKEARREIISQTVHRAPVDRVIAVGTKILPEQLGITDFGQAPFRCIVPRVDYITSYWGARDELGYHRGWDIDGETGDNLYAAASGTVIVAIGQDGFFSTKPGHSYEGYGYCVVIQHENGYSTMYAHCSRVNVKLGQVVKQGEKIAEVGNTGKSTGSHVHFEIMKNEVKLNPANFLYQGTTTIYDKNEEGV